MMIRTISLTPLYRNLINEALPIRQQPDEYGVYVLLDGALRFSFAGETLWLRPPSMLTVLPGEEYTVGGHTEGLSGHRIIFAFQGRDDLSELLRKSQTRIMPLTARCLKLIELLQPDGKMPTREDALSVSHILSALFYTVLDLGKSPRPHSSTYESYVQDSIDYMNRHIYDKITVSDISKALGVCGYHYIRLFKSVTGVTPMNYFLKLKTAKAAELLKATDLPIADIAEKLCFSSDAHFSRTFKRHMCDTPSIYRRQAALVTDRYTFNDMLLQTIIDSSPDLIFFKDKDFVLLGCNTAFCRVLGLDKARIIGKRDVDLFPYEEALFYNQIDEAILMRGKPQSNGEWMTFPDGTKKRFEVMKAPFYDESGSVAGIVGISREVAATRSRRVRNKTADEKSGDMAEGN